MTDSAERAGVSRVRERRTRGERTRSAVVSAATAAFREQGWEGTTTAGIAAAAGVSEATVFNHFGSKTQLLLVVMREYYEAALVELDEAVRGAGGPEARLRVMVRFWLERVVSDWSLARLFSQMGRFAEDGSVVAAYRELSRGVTGRVMAVLEDLRSEGRIAEGVPLWLLRDVVFGTGEHIALGAMARRREDVELGVAADAIVDLIVGGGAGVEGLSGRLAAMDEKLDRLLGAVSG